MCVGGWGWGVFGLVCGFDIGPLYRCAFYFWPAVCGGDWEEVDDVNDMADSDLST